MSNPAKPVRKLHADGYAFRSVYISRRGLEADQGTDPSYDAIGLNPAHAFRLHEDFEQAASGTLPAWLAFKDVSVAGTPTKDFDPGAACGTYTFAHDNTDEVQAIGLFGNDQLTVLSTGQPVFQARFKLNFGGATLSADQRFVIGLGSAYNANLDSVANHAWFRVEGASLNLLVESDDGATDTNDQDSGVDIVDNTFITVRIDASDLSSIKFYVDEEAGAGFVLRGVTSAAAMTGNLQVYAIAQKDGGTETDAVTVDYITVSCDRA
jgi:hypothetical protein